MKIYTRRGDDGTTSLIGGTRVRKDDPVIEAVGALDWFNCGLGAARLHSPEMDIDKILGKAQNLVFDIGAAVASPPERRTVDPAFTKATTALEESIDLLETDLPPLTNFVLPGSNPLAVSLHTARALCRNAERHCVCVMGVSPATSDLFAYLNRLSDWLFVAARTANLRAATPETIWQKEPEL